MRELFDGCVQRAMNGGCSNDYDLSPEMLDGLVERYEWFTAARVVRARQTNKLDDQLRLIAVMGLLPRTFIEDPTVEKIEESGSDESGKKTFRDSLNIIDDFLALDEEQLKLRPDEGFSDEDISASSVDFELDMVTEELAEIYLSQGNKMMALEIYNKLSLLNPEKSVYFAELISNINKN